MYFFLIIKNIFFFDGPQTTAYLSMRCMIIIISKDQSCIHSYDAKISVRGLNAILCHARWNFKSTSH